MPRRALASLALATLALVSLSIAGCEDPDPGGERLRKVQAELTKDQRIARYTQIKAAAAGRGVPAHAFLLAGIAYAETNLAHCWSEATWACKGPSTPDCNGPVIAGSADGPCGDQQGGLGMFQFDAGTYSQTLAAYGNDVLTVAGNVSHAIDFVLNMVKKSTYTTNAETTDKALAWINNFDINNGTLRDQWIKTVTRYYNGCLPTYSCWTQRYNHYNDSLSSVLSDTNGTAFWQTVVAPPPWKGTFVAQSFPFASQPFALVAGGSQAGYIELRNDGGNPWQPGEVFLGTTQPRDGASPLAGPDWVSDHRAATVDQPTAPGAVGRFSFTVHAPAQPGDYDQFFGLVREGVAWFSDGGQGGPPDNQLEVRLSVTAAPCPDGVGADWTCQDKARVRCDGTTGAVTSEPCPDGCSGPAGAAVCNDEGGAGGSGTSGSGGQGAGGAGKGGAGGSGGSLHGGQGGDGGDALSGSSGHAGGLTPGGAVTISAPDGDTGEGCAVASPGGAGGTSSVGSLLLAAGLLARRRRPRSSLA